jgi:predicted transcriptional regulator
MPIAKEIMAQILSQQPDDSTYDELLRELAHARTVQAGLADSDANRTLTDDEMRVRIASWQK